jgi:hypothetical protein
VDDDDTQPADGHRHLWRGAVSVFLAACTLMLLTAGVALAASGL